MHSNLARSYISIKSVELLFKNKQFGPVFIREKKNWDETLRKTFYIEDFVVHGVL